MEEERWRECLFYLTYSQYGGSALQVSYSDLMDMDLSEIFWFVQRLASMREHESEEIRKAKG